MAYKSSPQHSNGLVASPVRTSPAVNDITVPLVMHRHSVRPEIGKKSNIVPGLHRPPSMMSSVNHNIGLEISGVPFSVPPPRSSSCSALDGRSRGLPYQQAFDGQSSPMIRVQRNQTEGIFSKFLHEFSQPQCSVSHLRNRDQTILSKTLGSSKKACAPVDVDNCDTFKFFSPQRAAFPKHTTGGASEFKGLHGSQRESPFDVSCFKSMSSSQHQHRGHVHPNPVTSCRSSMLPKASVSTPNSIPYNVRPTDLSRGSNRFAASVVSNAQVHPLPMPGISRIETPKPCHQPYQNVSTGCQYLSSFGDPKVHLKPHSSSYQGLKIIPKSVSSRSKTPVINEAAVQKVKQKVQANQTNKSHQTVYKGFEPGPSIKSAHLLESSKQCKTIKPSTSLKSSSGVVLPTSEKINLHWPEKCFRSNIEFKSSNSSPGLESSCPASTSIAHIVTRVSVGSYKFKNFPSSSKVLESVHQSQQSTTTGMQQLPCMSRFSNSIKKREVDGTSDDEMPDLASTTVQDLSPNVLSYASKFVQFLKETQAQKSTPDDEMPDITSASERVSNPLLESPPSKPLRVQPNQIPHSRQNLSSFTLQQGLFDTYRYLTKKHVSNSEEDLNGFVCQINSGQPVTGKFIQPPVSVGVKEACNKPGSSVLGKRIGQNEVDQQDHFDHKPPEQKKCRKIVSPSSRSNGPKKCSPKVASSCSSRPLLFDNVAHSETDLPLCLVKKSNTKKSRGFQSVFEDLEIVTKLTGEAESELNDIQNKPVSCNDELKMDETKKKRKKSRYELEDLHTARIHHELQMHSITALSKNTLKQQANKRMMIGNTFIQQKTCLAKQLKSIPPCMECRKLGVSPRGGRAKYADHQCRFIAFRRLRIGANGKLKGCGFLSPNDARKSELKLWLPPDQEVEPFLNVEQALYIITNAGSGFCDLIEQEKTAMTWIKPGTVVAWKQAVEGVREMCDSCCTTVFNMHWTCSKCGHAICLDCYKSVLECQECVRFDGASAASPSDDDCTLCTACSRVLQRCIVTRKSHGCTTLMPTSVIPSNALLSVGKMIHEVRRRYIIKDGCPCGESVADELSALEPDRLLGNESSEGLKTTSSESQSTPKNKEPCSSCSTSEIKACCARPESDRDFKKPSEKASKVIAKVAIDRTLTSALVDETLAANWKVKALMSALITSHPTVSVPPIPSKEELSDNVAPHAYLDEGRLLQLLDPSSGDNIRMFRACWSRSMPVVVSNCQRKLDPSLWVPQSFSAEFGKRVNDLVDCTRNRILVGHEMRHFWDGFECIQARLRDRQNQPMILKLKDWPSTEDFADSLPSRFIDLLGALPLHEYTDRKGVFNLASRLPSFFVRPDLGPKMYTAYGSALSPSTGSTNLHLDISDAVNLMVYVGIPIDDFQRHSEAAMVAIEEAGCCELSKRRVTEGNLKPGALWHIFDPHDSNKIRELLRKVGEERNQPVEPNTDPIHDQSWYLDEELRGRLLTEYGVRGYTILQCLGDAIFIPAGAPHQVRNLHSCIKAAEDFVSPENLHYCFKLTQEFRYLSDTHTNHEDKLQVKNIIYHTVKDAVSVLLRD